MLVYVRTQSGTVHRAVETDGQFLTDERCNLDDAEKPLEVFEADPPESEDWCQRCFPSGVE
jgi:hypothetical protein